jgi:Uma2 family endonuclease
MGFSRFASIAKCRFQQHFDSPFFAPFGRSALQAMRPARCRRGVLDLRVTRGKDDVMTSEAKSRLTPEEYLAIERSTETKSEYFDGQVFAMVGASFAHVQVVRNLVVHLGTQLKGRSCQVLSNDLRLRVSPTGLYTYPDVIVACEPLAFADDHRDTLTNPIVIIEVLSETTKDYDRGGKFAHYRTLASLKEYLLFDQAAVHAEHFVRQPDNRWLLSETDSLADTLTLASVSAGLKLSEVYDGVSLGDSGRRVG